MALPKETIQLIEQVASDLERWLKNEPDKPFPDYQLLSETIFYSGSVDKNTAVKQLSRLDRIFLSLQQHNQGLAASLKEKVEGLKAELNNVDRLVGSGYSRRQCIQAVETPALRLVQTLRDIAEATKKPAETEENADKILGDKFNLWGFEIRWRVIWDKLKKQLSRLRAFLHKEK